MPKQARCRATVPQVRSELITLCSDCWPSSILVWTRVDVYRRTPAVLSHVAPEHPDHGPGEPYTLSQSSFCRNPCWSPGGTEEEPRWRKVSLHPNRLDLAPEQNPAMDTAQTAFAPRALYQPAKNFTPTSWTSILRVDWSFPPCPSTTVALFGHLLDLPTCILPENTHEIAAQHPQHQRQVQAVDHVMSSECPEKMPNSVLVMRCMISE